MIAFLDTREVEAIERTRRIKPPAKLHVKGRYGIFLNCPGYMEGIRGSHLP